MSTHDIIEITALHGALLGLVVAPWLVSFRLGVKYGRENPR